MTDDIPDLVAELRAFQEAVNLWNAMLDDGGDGSTLAVRAAAALEAQAQEIDSLRVTNLGHELGHTDALLRTRAENAERELRDRELHHFEEEQKSEAARAVIAEALTASWPVKHDQVAHMRAVLLSSPVDILRERDKRVWREGAEWMAEELQPVDQGYGRFAFAPGDNPYEEETDGNREAGPEE